MLDKLVFLSEFYYTQGVIGDILSTWEQEGFFAYLFPFLLIFAVVFVLITRLKAFKDNRAVSGIVAASVALMAVQLEMVPKFFSEVFPRLGVGVIVLLVLLILLGAFMDPKKGGYTIFLIIAGSILFVVVISTSFSSANIISSGSSWWDKYGTTVVGASIIAVLIGIIIGFGGDKDSSSNDKETKALIFGGGD